LNLRRKICHLLEMLCESSSIISEPLTAEPNEPATPTTASSVLSV